MMLLAALAIVAPAVSVKTGLVIPRGELTAGRPADHVLGPGLVAEIDLGARLWSIVTPYVFAERTWFGCGANACGAASWTFGAGMRIEVPRPRARPFLDLGLGHRSVEAAHSTNGSFIGTSAAISFFDRERNQPRYELTGLDFRTSMGVTFAITRMFELDFAAHLSIGRFSTWHPPPNVSLDPNAPRPDDRIPTDGRTTHAFYGLSLGARLVPW